MSYRQRKREFVSPSISVTDLLNMLYTEHHLLNKMLTLMFFNILLHLYSMYVILNMFEWLRCQGGSFCRQQSQVDVDSGIDTMEVDDVDQQRAETKRKRVCVLIYM